MSPVSSPARNAVLAFLVLILVLVATTTYAEKIDVKAQQLMYERSWDNGVVVVLYQLRYYGTGWWVYVSPNGDYGYIVTAAHVVQFNPHAGEGDIQIIKGSFEARGEVVYLDRFSDVCIIKVRPVPPTYHVFPIRIGVEKGDKIIVIGYPYELLSIYSNDINMLSANPRASFGEVTWVDENYRLAELGTYTDAGNSGGPVINEKGEVVGIVTFALSGRSATLYFMTLSHSIVEALQRANVPFQLSPESRLSDVVGNPWLSLAMIKANLIWIGVGALAMLLVVLPMKLGRR